MNNKSYIVLVKGRGDLGMCGHAYTRRYDAECRAYEFANRNPANTYYVAEVQTKYKATEVVVTELT